MGRVSSYPSPGRDLVDSDVVLGDAGKTAAIRMDAMAGYFQNNLNFGGASGGADVAALQVTSSYNLPTGSVKKEALFAALATAGHLDDLLANLPAVLNSDGTSNDAGVQLAYAMTLLPTSAGALYVKSRYYASDPSGWATLLSSAGAGNTQPSTVTVAAVVAAAGARGDAVMDQATVTAMLATKPDHFPGAPHLPLQSAKDRVISGWFSRFYDTANGHLRPTDGSGDWSNGLPDTVTVPSSWQAGTGHNVPYEEWQFRRATGGDTSTVAAQIASDWAWYQTKYTATQIKAGSGGVINTSDDASWCCGRMRQVHEVTGDGNAIAYLVECLSASFTRFHDPNQTAISYGVSTPGGIAMQSDPNGIRYFDVTKTGSAYSNSITEVELARCDLYVARSTFGTTALRNAHAQRAMNTWLWVHNLLRTPGCISGPVTTPPVDGIYNNAANLDPNAATNEPGQTYLKGVRFLANADAPIRGQTSYHDGMTMLMGALSAELYAYTGDPKYLAEVVAIAAAMPAANGFGRTKFGGVPMLVNGRDPWITGWGYSPFVRAVFFSDPAHPGVPLTGVDPTGKLRISIVNTAEAIAATLANGYTSPDWSGPEYCPYTGLYLWSEEGSIGGQGGDVGQDYGGRNGGGQARPQELMAASSNAGAVLAGTWLEPYAQAFGSGLATAQGVENLPARVAALEIALTASMPRTGGYFTGFWGLDKNFYFNRNTSVYINFDDQDLYQYNRPANQHEFYVANALKFYVAATGATLYGALSTSGFVRSINDNTDACGGPSNRWSTVYAGTGTINTSDLTQKTVRGALSDPELAAAKEIAGSTIVFQFNDAIAAKGEDGARLHVGFGAQTAFAIMTSHGLDPKRYAFCCYDKWDADPGEPAVEGEWGGDGRPITMPRPGRPARAAGELYGLRMDELQAFIGAAQEQRLAALEAK